MNDGAGKGPDEVPDVDFIIESLGGESRAPNGALPENTELTGGLIPSSVGSF